MIAQKADVHVVKKGDKGNGGRTYNALFYAVRNGHAQAAKLLIEAGLSVVDDESLLACAASHGHADVVQLLIENKADLQEKDAQGQDVFTCAAAQGHTKVVRVLLAAGMGNSGQTESVFRACIQKIDNNISMQAWCNRQKRVVQLLIASGIDCADLLATEEGSIPEPMRQIVADALQKRPMISEEVANYYLRGRAMQEVGEDGEDVVIIEDVASAQEGAEAYANVDAQADVDAQEAEKTEDDEIRAIAGDLVWIAQQRKKFEDQGVMPADAKNPGNGASLGYGCVLS